MKTISFNELENIQANGLSQFIGGACAATALIRIAGLWTPAAPVSIGIGVLCVANAIGGNQGWW
jgi:hypothetical protein